MIKLHLPKRLTNHFGNGWSGLDQTRYLTDAKLTRPRITSTGNGHDVGNTFTQRARVPAGTDRKLAMQALQFAMSGSNCRHEHDCCGCQIRYVQVKPLGKREFFVRTSVYFNY